MNKPLVLGAVIALLAGPPAMACSRSNWNVYSDFREPSLAGLVDRASTIDWIAVDAGPVRCPSAQRTQEQPDQTVQADAECSEYPRGDGDFGARVLERLKGASPDRFVLSRLSEPYVSDGRWYAGVWQGFSDPRELPLQHEAETAQAAKARAARHSRPEFWDRGALEFQTDGFDSCGGGPTLDPGMRYVAFRDERGSVLALEPIEANDDLLLARLRARRADAAAPMTLGYPVEAFFKSATGLVLIRIQSCRGGGDSYESETATVVTVRGAPAYLFESQWSVRSSGRRDTTYEHAAPGSRRFQFNDLWDHFAARGERCPERGEKVLLVRPSFGAPDGDDYGVDRPIRVGVDGTVKLTDISTALHLTGPETVTVDQVFEWFEEGRSARVSPVPSSS